ncbi:serine hydrolase domain-containing protein [Chthonobacter albigriseus]|uniref:serine hydrolase domain-containing protein n=1 Tax=Chthonobacter albigriseus TaxID=1683161 RepID=UPI0015EEDDD1|nr:serine hydrolase [Chthonobacter albigriseus]
MTSIWISRFVPALLTLLVLLGSSGGGKAADRYGALLDRAAEIDALETVLISVDGRVVAEHGYHGASVGQPTNIKSASKTIVSALVGIAIAKGLLEGPDQRIGALVARDMPRDADPRLRQITIGHLLSMQAGLARTSGPNYGKWVASRNWVRSALAQPFEDEPGGRMLYSTGSTHILSAILTRVSGRSTLQLAREWLKPLKGFSITSWDRDPQGVYFGGNQMAMSPRSLLAFGELYRRGGVTPDGTRLITPEWIEASWRPRTSSRFSGDGYGYGWFARSINGHDVRYAWGFGGQMLYVVPDLKLTVVMTSDDTRPSARTGHRDRLHGLLGEIIGITGSDLAIGQPASGPAGAEAGEGKPD